MITDRLICAPDFLGGNDFLLTLMFKEVLKTLPSLVKQNNVANNLEYFICNIRTYTVNEFCNVVLKKCLESFSLFG